jgi:putative ABC transport system permease protein
MLKSYFTTALRHLIKNKGYTILNAVGLSVGLACFALIGLWVINELSYDQFHDKANRIYRVSGVFSSESDRMQQAVTPTPLRTALISDLPEVENAVIIDNNDAIVQRGDKQFMEDYLLMTEPSFFDIFSFQLKSGNAKTALTEPYSIVLSESMAIKYFGDENPIGQDLTIFLQDPEGKGKAYTVTGVIEDCPLNSHFNYTALVSFKTFEVNNPTDPRGYDWYNNGYYTYLLLRNGSDPHHLEAKLPQLIEKYMGKQNREWKISYEYFLQPLTDIHLHSKIKYEIKETNSVSYVVIFGTIGLIVLLLACINYVNLATAFSSGRFKEVGMRKVMGAYKRQLIGQYLAESWMLAMTSLVLAIVWIELARPLFESLTGKPVMNLYSPETLLTLLAVTSLVGIFSGLYPALMLSSYRPISIMRGQLKTGTAGVLLRKSLVVLQYSITILLVVGILVVQRQLKFIQNQDLGFNQEHLLMLGVNGSQEVISGYEAFAHDIKSLPVVNGITRSNTTLAGGLGNSVAEMEDASGKKVNTTVYRVRTDFDYLEVYQMKLLAGRFFEAGNAADSTKGFVVNEALAHSYGYSSPDEIIGKIFQFQGRDGEVIGVMKDFNYNSLHHRVEPTCLYLLRGGFSQIAVRLTGNTFTSREEVTKLWKKHFPSTLLDARFAEEALNSQYQSEQRFSQIFLVFSVISLAIACLGLFALVSFSVESRTKEIGIRKVLGASVTGILGMFSKEFLLLIVIAAFIAVPVGYYFMNQWLSGFAYRTDLNPVVFLLAGLLVLMIAWLTVSARSIKAATTNPVDSLRNE